MKGLTGERGGRATSREENANGLLGRLPVRRIAAHDGGGKPDGAALK